MQNTFSLECYDIVNNDYNRYTDTIPLTTKKHSPLESKALVRRLRFCPHPLRSSLFLLWPVPWFFPQPTPLLSTRELDEHPEIVQKQQGGIKQLIAIPLFWARDMPLRSLCRLFEDICSKRLVEMGFEADYFFFHAGLGNPTGLTRRV